jgi:molecular chaperone DnaK (HSP70)
LFLFSNIVFDVKRLIGRRFTDATVQADKALFPFEVSKDKDGKPILKLPNAKQSSTEFTPEEISSMILRKMKETGML